MQQRQPRRADTAGSSARRRAARARNERERRSSQRSRLARVVALLAPPAEDLRLREQELRFTRGARGEEMLAETLARRCPRVLLLHDRRTPGSRGNIDHIAVAPTGVYVIDCKRWRGDIRVARPLLGAARLRVDGRDRTSAIAGLSRQVAAVRAALGPAAEEVPIHGCLCFVEADGLPLFRTLCVDGFPLYSPRRLARRLNQRGPLSTRRALAIHEQLARGLPPR